MQSWIFSGYFNDYRESLQINQSFGDQLLTLVKQEYLSIKNESIFDSVTQVLKRALNQRTHLEVEFLKKAFKEVSFFTSVEREMNSFFVSKLLKHLQYEFIEARTEIFKAAQSSNSELIILITTGDKGQDMYIILKGQVWEMNEIPNVDEEDPNMEPLDPEILKMLPEQDFLLHCYPTHAIYNTKKSGDYFGEISLRHGHPREFTTVTKEDTHFATISRVHFNDCVALYFQKTRDDFLYFFTTFTIFQTWKKNEIEVAMLNCVNAFYKKDTLIYKEEEKDENIYFIYSGEVEISHNCDIYDKDPNSLYNKREDILLQKEELFNAAEFTSQNKHLKINKIINSLLLAHKDNVKESHHLDIKNEKILKKEELQKEISQKQRQGIKLLWQTVRVPISILGQGESFGEEEVFQNKVRCTQARVVSAEAQILVMPLAEFKKMMIKRKRNYQEYTEYYIKNIIHNKVLNRQQQLADSLKIKQLYLQYEHQNYISDANSLAKKKKKKKRQSSQRPVSAAINNMKQSSILSKDKSQTDKKFSNTGNGFFVTTTSSSSIKRQSTVKLRQFSPQNTREDTIEEYQQEVPQNLKENSKIVTPKKHFYSEDNQLRCKSAQVSTRCRNRILTTNTSRESSLDKINKILPNSNETLIIERKILNIPKRNMRGKTAEKKTMQSTSNEIQIIDQSTIKDSSVEGGDTQVYNRNKQNITSFNFFYNKSINQSNSKEDLTISTTQSKTQSRQFQSQQNTPKNNYSLNQSYQNSPSNKNNHKIHRLLKVKNIFNFGQDSTQNIEYPQKDQLVSDLPKQYNNKERRKSNQATIQQQNTALASQRNSTSEQSHRSSLSRSYRPSINQQNSNIFETVRNDNESDKEELEINRDIDPRHEVLYGDEHQQLGIQRTYYNTEMLKEVEQQRKTVSVNTPIIDIHESLLQERQRKLQDRQYIQEKYKFLPKQLDTNQTTFKQSDIQQISLEKNNKRIPFNAAKFYLRKDEKNKYFTQSQLQSQNNHSKKNTDVYNSNNPGNATNQQKAYLNSKQNEQYQNMINTFLKYNKTSVQDEINLIKNCIIQYNVDTRIPLPPNRLKK